MSKSPFAIPGRGSKSFLSTTPTNGYSLLRKILEWLPLDVAPPPLTRPLIDALLEPHRSYLNILTPILKDPRLKALVHITGGGLVENLPRVFPEGIAATVDISSWPKPPLFEFVEFLTSLYELPKV